MRSAPLKRPPPRKSVVAAVFAVDPVARGTPRRPPQSSHRSRARRAPSTRTRPRTATAAAARPGRASTRRTGRTRRGRTRAPRPRSTGRSGRKKTVSSDPTRRLMATASGRRGGVRQPGLEPSRMPARAPRSARRQLSQRRDSGGHRQRVARQGARLVDRAERRDQFHEVGASAVCPDRHAAADDLAEHRQVGPNAESRLRAAVRDAEPRDDLVEDQHRAVGRRLVPELLEEPRRRWDRRRRSPRPAR